MSIAAACAALRLLDCIVTFRVQQHFVQASEHAMSLQQLRALCFDGSLDASDRRDEIKPSF